jgi:hypothetical protein
MNVEYVCATPELEKRLQERSGSNASDFIRFNDNTYSLITLLIRKEKRDHDPR